MHCLYCNILISGKISEWVKCDKCNVEFHNFCYDKSLHHIKWERTINQTNWALNIYPYQQYSILVGSPIEYQPYFGTECLTEIEMNCALKVSPENIISKMKTLIMFS